MMLSRWSSGILRRVQHQQFPLRQFSSVSPEITLDRLTGDDEGICVLTLDRPRSKNALGKALMADFRIILDELRFDTNARCLIVRSACPGVFCAGADLKERREMDELEVAQFVHGLRSSFLDLQYLPLPTIASVDGAALGGGLELALACDMRVASSSAKFGLPETALAIIPGAGGTQRLARLVGGSIAKELTFTARRFDSSEAARLGIVNHAVESDSSFEKALEIAREIVPNGPVACRVAKQAIDRGLDADVTTGMQIEQLCYAQVIPTQDRLEGLQAFMEKRKPKYTGK